MDATLVSEIAREAVRQVGANTHRDHLDDLFGRDPWSLSRVLGLEQFSETVARRAEFRSILAESHVTTLDEVSTSQWVRLGRVVSHFDRYGTLVHAWRAGHAPPPACQADQRQRLVHWAGRHTPLWAAEALDPERLAKACESWLRERIRGYRFDQDVWVWAIPHLVDTLLAALPVRDPAAARDGLRPRFESLAARILDEVERRCGVVGVDAREVTGWALYLVTQAPREEWNDHVHEIDAWAAGKLVDAVKDRVLEVFWGPDLADADPGPAERRRRRLILEVFTQATGVSNESGSPRR